MKTLMHGPPNLNDLPQFSLSLSQPRQWLAAASSFKLKVGGVATAVRDQSRKLGFASWQGVSHHCCYQIDAFPFITKKFGFQDSPKL
jgi:hypothetical protein